MLETPTSLHVDGLRLDIDEFGPDRRLVRLTAERDLTGLASDRFDDPIGDVLWPSGALPADAEWCGFASTQFALPVTAGASLDFDFAPAHGLRSPPVVLSLLGRSGGRVTLLAPTRRRGGRTGG